MTDVAGKIIMPPFEDMALDLRGCRLFEVSVGLTEYDKPGQRYDAWPETVRAYIERECRSFMERNPGAEIVAITHGVVRGNGGFGSCVFCLHWRPKP